MSEPKPDGKPFAISKRLVWEAWRRVKANRGAEGVDEESIQVFEANLRDNLYKVWNRMSSGSYMLAAGQGGRDTEEDGRVESARRAHGRG